MLNFVFVNLDVKAVGICIVGHRGKAFYISRQMKPNAIGGLPSGAIFLSTENKDKILCILRNGLTSHCWNIFSQNNPQRNATSLCMTVIFSMAKALCNGCLYCNHVCPWIEVPLIIDRDIWFDKHNRQDVWLYKRQVCQIFLSQPMDRWILGQTITISPPISDEYFFYNLQKISFCFILTNFLASNLLTNYFCPIGHKWKDIRLGFVYLIIQCSMVKKIII